MKKFNAMDAAKFAGVEKNFMDVLKKNISDDELIKEVQEINIDNSDIDQKIQKIKDDFINSDFVDISDI